MKILWLRPNKPNNVSVGRHRIAERLREAGHHVEVRNTHLRSFRSVLATDPDVVVGTTRLGALVGCWKKALDGTPLVVDHIDPISQLRRNHGPASTWAISQLEKLAFQLADHVLVVYEDELPRIKRYNSNVTETALGVDYYDFATPDEDVLSHAFNIIETETDPARRTLVYVGGLEPVYNLPTVVEAMDYLDGWQLLVLGDGSQRDRIEAAAANSGRIVYLGTVNHEYVPGFLHGADAGICLSDDPNTLKILEYGAAGLPTVSVEGEPEARYEGLVEFCSLDPEDVACAVERAAEDAPVEEFRAFTKQFGWDAIASEYESVLRSVVGEASTQ